MIDKKSLLILGIPLLLVGAVIFGQSNTKPVVAATPTATVSASNNQVANNSYQAESKVSEPAEQSESANETEQEANLPNGGHQDAGAQVDHQFEGVE